MPSSSTDLLLERLWRNERTASKEVSLHVCVRVQCTCRGVACMQWQFYPMELGDLSMSRNSRKGAK